MRKLKVVCVILTSVSSVDGPDVPLGELVGFPLSPVDPIGFTPTVGVQWVECGEPGRSSLVTRLPRGFIWMKDWGCNNQDKSNPGEL